MRKLIWVVLGASLLWGTYWFVGSRAVEQGLTGWLANQRGPLEISYSALNTRGFPNRFDTTFDDPKLSDIGADFEWSAPFFQIFALSYLPNKIIAVWPNEQSLTIGSEKLSIRSSDMRASIQFEAGTALTLNKTSFVAENLTLSARSGDTLKIATGRFATRQNSGTENAHDVALTLLDLLPTNRMISLIDPTEKLPKTVKSLQIETTLGFDAPWDRFALEGETPQLSTIRVDKMRLVWADMKIDFNGDLVVGRDGFLIGVLNLTAENWRRMLKIAVDTGLVQPNISETFANALAFLAEVSGDPDTLETSITFKNGRMSLGPIPLGPAPRLAL